MKNMDAAQILEDLLTGQYQTDDLEISNHSAFPIFSMKSLLTPDDKKAIKRAFKVLRDGRVALITESRS